MSSRIALGAFGSIAVAVAGSAPAANYTFTFDGGPSGTGTDWNTGVNWSGSGATNDKVPQANTWDADGSGTATADLDATEATIPSGFSVAMSANGGARRLNLSGSLNIPSGVTLTTTNNQKSEVLSTGILTVGGTFTGQQLWVQSGGSANVTGTITFSNNIQTGKAGTTGGGIHQSGSSVATTDDVWIGNGAAGSTYKISGNSTVTAADELFIGKANQGTFHVVGSTVTVSAADLFVDAGSTLRFDLGSSGIAPIAVSTAITIDNLAADLTTVENTSLVVDFSLYGGTLVPNQTFLLVDGNSSVGLAVGEKFGAFSALGLPGGWSASPVYDTANGDISVQVVPEPTALTVLGLGVLALGARRRRV